MPYYTRTYNPQPTARVSSTDLKNEFQAVENGLAAAETADGKAIRAPEATTALPNAASRALKVMSFDASGNPIATVLAGDVADAADNAAIATAKAAEAAASAVAAHDSELAAAASAAAVDIPALESGKYLSNNGVDMVWQAITPPQVLQRAITSTDTLIAADRGKLINASGTFTLSVTAAATLGNGWYCWLRNTSNRDVTIDPASTEQIDGATTYVLKPGFTVLLTCNGAAFTTLKVKERTYDNIASYTASGTFVVPADTYVIRGYAWGRGADGTTTQGGAGGPGAGGGAGGGSTFGGGGGVGGGGGAGYCGGSSVFGGGGGRGSSNTGGNGGLGGGGGGTGSPAGTGGAACVLIYY